MCRNYFLLFIAFTLTLTIGCSENKHSPTESTTSKLDKLSAPNEHMWAQRAYPDAHVDFKAMNKVAQRVSETTNQKSADSPWTLEGPTNIGGRINAVALHPEDANTILVGAAAGGVFKTTDGGANWEAIGDDFNYLAIAHIQFDLQDPDIVYVATGDPNISGLPHLGNGLYKSIDGGDSWTNIGLAEQRIMSKVAIHPTEPNTLFAGTMGLPFERNEERGFYKSIDGGANWDQTLYLGDDAGICDLKVNPQNPDIVFAAGWNRIRNNQESVITGTDARIYRSTDGALTWDTLTVGLPQDTLCRIGLEMSINDPNTLWAIIISQGFGVEGVYKTTDGGDSWTNLITDPFALEGALGGFGWYFAKVRANPWNENEISVLGVDLWTSFDNGETWEMTTPPWWAYEVHADKHDMIYLSDDVIMLATDGGLYKTTDHFATWTDIDNIPNTQFYRIALDPFNPGVYTGGAQDNGTTTGNESTLDEWVRDYGGDGFQCIYDYEDPSLRYMETQYGNIVFDIDGFTDNFTFGIDPEDRNNWDTPYIMSSISPQTMYTGTHRMYQITDAPFGSWNLISDDLTDGNIFGANFHTISTIADDPLDESLIYTGTTDGNLWKGENVGGFEWTNIQAGLPDRWVTSIEVSSATENRLWVSQSGYKDNDETAHLHRSDDAGQTWIDISGDLPEQPVNHLEVVNDSILFIATDFGVYSTINAGENWIRVGNNMPTIPVFDVKVDTALHTLVAGTFARGIWTFPTDSLYILTEPEIVININELAFSGLSFYPNPTQNFLTLKHAEGALVQLFDLNGKLVHSHTSMTSEDQFSIANLKSGKYVMLLTRDSERSIQNLVKL